jgi:diaminopimelate decarboxylase
MGATLEEIAGAAGTPVYVYDGDVFRERIAELRRRTAGGRVDLAYAVKANDALALLAIVAAEGIGADVVSGGELFRAMRAGIPAGRIVFSGVGKRRDEIRDALTAGIRSLNVESAGELETVAEEARAAGLTARVSVRVNADVAADTHAYIATGSAASKFGVPVAEAAALLRRAAAEPVLEPVGLSFHVGSQLFDPAPVHAAAAAAALVWREVASEGIALRDLDAGGGLGVAYEGGPDVDVDAHVGPLLRLARELGATLLLEPGRWIAAPAGTLLTRVLYVKDMPGRRVAVCDAGMNTLIRPSLYRAYHPIDVLGAGERPRGPVDVVGPICESGDFLALGRELPLPEPGDLVAVRLAGAYGRVLSSAYNAQPRAAEVLVEGGAWRVVRDRGTYEDLLAGERV